MWNIRAVSNTNISPEYRLTWGPAPAEGRSGGWLRAWHFAWLCLSWTQVCCGFAPVEWPFVYFAPLPKPWAGVAQEVVSPPRFPPENTPRSLGFCFQPGRPWIPSLRCAAVQEKTNVSYITGIWDKTGMCSEKVFYCCCEEMNSFRVIFGQPYHDTGELFIKTKSAVTCYVVLLNSTHSNMQNTSDLLSFFLLAAEWWLRWRSFLFCASRDSSFRSYWTTWRPWAVSATRWVFLLMGLTTEQHVNSGALLFGFVSFNN